jgi:type III restriction enzyme
VEAAEALTEALVESGFEKFEAKAMVRPEPGALPLEGTLFERPVSEAVTAPPRMESLPKSLAERLTVKTEEGRVELVYEGAPLSDAEAGALKDAFAEPADKQAVERLCRRSRGESVSPASLGRRFSVPLLAVRDGDQLDMFEDQFRDIPWHLSECDPRLSEKEFAGKPPDKGAAKVDVDKEGRIGYEFVEELERGLTLLERHGPTTETELAFWLDRRIEHPDITHADAGLYLRRLVDSLVRERGFGLEQLVGQRFRLRDAVKEKINALRQAALNEAYQRMLLPGAATPIEVSPEVCFTFPINVYPADTFYRGAFHPRKHYYDNMADMNGEEAECAAVIDALPEVEHWVRNLERGAYAFWLQMPTGKFYPDFVARLNDGRYLVVEYKGGHLYTDAEAKRQVGELWEARSNSRCLFVMPTKKQYDGIAAKVRRR